MINQKSQSSDIRRVAVVGSGLAGLSAARLLTQQGTSVTLFEKSRGPGGRLAAKRVTGGSADVGAQYFTIRSPEFSRFLHEYAGEAAFAAWEARFGYQQPDGRWQAFPEEPRYVGTPRMTAISRALASGLEIQAETRIAELARTDTQWTLTDTAGQHYGPFDAVIITAPPAQARDLLADSALPDLAQQLNGPVSAILPCWAVAAYYETPPTDTFEGMRPNHDILYWVANNSSKPGRDDKGQWWVLHATPQWSADNEHTPAEEVMGSMVAAFQELTGAQHAPVETVSHRWLYARSADSDRPGCLWFPDDGIGLAGDWLAGGRVEGAFDSARSLINAMNRV
ncbi:NAD(P)/FAD-dependent oxidoreductase [Marinobacter goseongensis]|uniref:NAD(P)/FAD-dependent oxidoreductase n=1 Tax=Marinobacter goseongensis TaxID=453838 RepID=UPI0020050DAE|nr:FAD-dependent oxidoreductase [Marinobacter goseongensis]MCK7550128.1 FAD-dependent oxidoreductase [Marinobacter goseongensis]